MSPETPPDVSPLSLLWQDEHLVALHKPTGWLVHRTGLDAHEHRIIQTRLRDQLGRWVYPVHRLDKGTSGVLLMALSPGAARACAQAFEARLVGKHYLALVRGWPPFDATVDHALRPDDAPPDAPAQDARTRLRCLATLGLPIPVDRYPSTRAALVLAEPETGRRHQIRRHLKHLAHPIVGDATHGKGPVNRWWAGHLQLQRLWLHAWRLSLAHPVTGEPLRIESSLQSPDNADWRGLWQGHAWQLTSPEARADQACSWQARLQTQLSA
jgi:tRNA pseudouridine65 synthase